VLGASRDATRRALRHAMTCHGVRNVILGRRRDATRCAPRRPPPRRGVPCHGTAHAAACYDSRIYHVNVWQRPRHEGKHAYS
jgi:hypothetical protein